MPNKHLKVPAYIVLKKNTPLYTIQSMPHFCFQYKQLSNFFNLGELKKHFQQTQKDQTPGITSGCPYKGKNEDTELLKMLFTCEVSVQGNRNVTSPMQGPLFGILMLHSVLESHFYCTVTTAKCVHKTLYRSARRKRSQGQSECLSPDLRVYYKLVG